MPYFMALLLCQIVGDGAAMDQYASQVIGSEHPWKMGCESKALLGTDGQWEEGGCHQEAAAGGCS